MRVLLLGRDEELSRYRLGALEAAGLRVLWPRGKDEAVEMIRAGDFDVALLSYTLTKETTEQLAELLRQSCPRCPLIVISQNAWDDPRISPDKIVLASDGPDTLIAAIKSVQRPSIRRVK